MNWLKKIKFPALLTLILESSYGQKRYSRCYERYARTANDCRGSSYRNYDYRDNYDRLVTDIMEDFTDFAVGTTDMTGMATMTDMTTRSTLVEVSVYSQT